MTFSILVEQVMKKERKVLLVNKTIVEDVAIGM
jgi:hypothetical protein